MKILAIETSCDETALSVIEAKGGFTNPSFKILGHTIASQIAIHKQWGGVVPSLAKREHGKAIIPLLQTTLADAKLFKPAKNPLKPDNKLIKKTALLLEKEPDLSIDFLNTIPQLAIPKIDAIAVTYGPGLEPALWVGINFARALSLWWQKPVIPTNHMEGHIFSSLASDENNYKLQITNDKLNSKIKNKNSKIQFPAIALLVSGGHTEIVLIKGWMKYKVIGKTRDDAVGEAFDKVARLLGLPYPGGPEISKLADLYTKNFAAVNPHGVGVKSAFVLPRPMHNSGDYDFSFSGLKTAVLYLIKKIEPLSDEDKKAIAYEFQTAAVDVLIQKTLKAVKEYGAKSLIVGGGVIANKELKTRLKKELNEQSPDTALLLPNIELSTDNATMIAIAAYFQSLTKTFKINPKIKAKGNLSF